MVRDETCSEKRARSTKLGNAALETEHSFQLLVQSVSDYAIYMLDPEGYVTSWNTGAARIKGYTEDEIVGRNFELFYTPEARAAGEPGRALARALRDGKYETEGLRVRRDGSPFHASIIIEPVRDPYGTLIGFAKVTRDITESKVAEAAARSTQRQIADVFSHASVGLALTDATMHFALVNDAFCRMVGRSREELMSLSMQDVSHPDSTPTSLLLIEQLKQKGISFVVEKKYVRPDGTVIDAKTSASVVLGQNGRPSQPLTIVAVIEDITERKHAEDRLNYLAYHDALTGLANRIVLKDRLKEHLLRADRSKGPLAIIALDLDRFKIVNDSFGHDAGDALLLLVAARLRGCVRETDVVARIGGDEFAIVQFEGGRNAAAGLARRIIEVLSMPFDLQGREVLIAASIGIALYPADGSTEAILLKNADTALYRAKSKGGGCFRFFKATIDGPLHAPAPSAADLRRAIGTEQLRLHYQPIVACVPGTLTGFEALLRWQHPILGIIQPADFIPLAERTGLIIPIGLWVMESACAEAMSWAKPFNIAVNVSSVQFNSELPAQVNSILQRTGLTPKRLELELTETMLVNKNEPILEIFQALKELGIRIALDDFGTGYSSLSYLATFPFDKLKIDKSFVQKLGVEERALLLVQAILAMARKLRLKVTAEGVETEQQWHILRKQRCDEAQGFFFAKPIQVEEIDRLIDVFCRHPNAAA